MEDDDPLEWPEEYLQAKRLKSVNLFLTHGKNPTPGTFSIKKDPGSKFRTPTKEGSSIKRLLPERSPEFITEKIDESDSDTEMEEHPNIPQDVQMTHQHTEAQPQNQNFGRNQLQNSARGFEQANSETPKIALRQPFGKLGSDSLQGGKTPLSAQRNFLSSHLKSGLLNTVPSSAVRPETKKGLGVLANQLQQALKKRSENSSDSGLEFLVQNAHKSQDLWIAKCNFTQNIVMPSLQDFSEAFVIFRQQPGLEVYPQMKLKATAPVCKFKGPDGLFICLSEFVVIE